ncbi:MAG: zinc-ribbon domain-containing protein [Deltaproteobacteria bacterium]|nr:zinc-ribbon domain-containing protein [Deltaproteobacteria bacterium]
MKFHCERCNTRYTIPDEKLKGKILKVRCKTCGNIMTVGGHKKSNRTAHPTSSQLSVHARAARGKVSLLGLPASNEESAARLLANKPASPAHGRGSTSRVKKAQVSPSGSGRILRKTVRPDPALDPEPALDFDGGGETIVSQPGLDLASLRAEEEAQPETRQSPAIGFELPEEEDVEWYLADDNGQYGPMNFSELAARIRRGEHDPDAQVWREGFDDWMDLDQIPELAPQLKHVPPPRKFRPDRDDDFVKRAPDRHIHTEFEQGPLVPKPTRAPGQVVVPPKIRRPEERRVRNYESDDLADMIPPLVETRSVAPGAVAAGREDSGLLGVAPIPVLEQGQAAVDPIGVRRDRNQTFAIIFAVMGGIAVLALVILVGYLIFGNRHGTEAPKPSVAQNTTTAPPAGTAKQGTQVVMSAPQTTTTGGTSTPSNAHGGQDIVMDPIEIGLRPDRSAKPDATRTKPAARKPARSSGSSLASSLSGPSGSFGGFGGSSLPTKRHAMPTPSIDKPHSAGSRSRTTRPVTKPEVIAVVRRHVHRLKRCYERAVRLHPVELRRAKMKVSIRVSSSGHVTRVTIRPGKYRGLSFGDCIVSSIHTWKFPPSTRSYGTGFPLSFVGK